MVIDAGTGTIPKSLEINATNVPGPKLCYKFIETITMEVIILMGAGTRSEAMSNFAWETNGEHMLVIVASRSESRTWCNIY